jgi:glyoxylase-like metal-dependent hydrolase (beta-lactamase superfamily II)
MAVYHVPTGVIHRSAAFAYAGGSYYDKRDFAMSAVLVQHPRGDLLIDSGIGKDVATHLGTMPFLFRAITDHQRGRSVAESLAAAGYDRKRLRGVLLTHAHWDHVSGLPELDGTPVLVTAAERRFIKEGGQLTALIRSFPNVHYEEYDFEGGAYLGFARSHDVYGDGSVVVVPAPGHTPGSILVFLALPGGERYALLGDLSWQLEGITERRQRPWLWRSLGDEDPAAVSGHLLHMAALMARFPELVLLPAHDQRGYARLPQLAAARAH